MCEVEKSRSMGMRCKSQIGESPSNVAKEKIWDRREGEEGKAMSFLKMGGVEKGEAKGRTRKKDNKIKK